MDTRAERIYAELLRKKLKRTSPEHSARVDSIPDRVLIDHERRHTETRIETFKARVEAARVRAQKSLTWR